MSTKRQVLIRQPDGESTEYRMVKTAEGPEVEKSIQAFAAGSHREIDGVFRLEKTLVFTVVSLVVGGKRLANPRRIRPERLFYRHRQ